ncbi:hypothetical protein [Amnibacterium sp.]|uniref:hypothetical protein n=1 Tax=Amnibacterium sp. TaxID=1872496 RepID=UPI003F7B6552
MTSTVVGVVTARGPLGQQLLALVVELDVGEQSLGVSRGELDEPFCCVDVEVHVRFRNLPV